MKGFLLILIYNRKRIGNRLRTERKKAGFKNMESLGERIGASRQTIAKWEKGEEMPPLDVLCTLCALYQCDLGYLLCEYDYKTRTAADIGEITGLSDEAINTLAGLKGLLKLFPEDSNIKDKYRIINLILMDTHKKQSLSSLLDRLVGFCQFSVNKNYAYTVDTNGITPFQGHKSISGKGISYNPSQAHFRLQDMESMYYLKIWDSIKELKEEYEKVSDTN